ncbi:hypothetical protein LINGRAHAP2_LOCUS6193, partial [Linum grandiflorum]
LQFHRLPVALQFHHLPEALQFLRLPVVLRFLRLSVIFHSQHQVNHQDFFHNLLDRSLLQYRNHFLIHCRFHCLTHYHSLFHHRNHYLVHLHYRFLFHYRNHFPIRYRFHCLIHLHDRSLFRYRNHLPIHCRSRRRIGLHHHDLLLHDQVYLVEFLHRHRDLDTTDIQTRETGFLLGCSTQPHRWSYYKRSAHGIVLPPPSVTSYTPQPATLRYAHSSNSSLRTSPSEQRTN